MKFSIRHLMALTAAVAVLCAVLFAIPSAAGAAILGIGLLWLPVIVVSGVIYSRDWQRTFFIGCAVGAAPFIVALLFFVPRLLVEGLMLPIYESSPSEDETLTSLKFVAAGYLVYVATTGVAAVIIRWLVSPRPKETETPSAIEPQYAVLQRRFTTEVIPRSEPANSPDR